MKMDGKNTYRKKPNGRYEYLRTCVECGDEKYITSKPKVRAVCKKCSSSALMKRLGDNNKKKYEDRVHYWYFCPTCASVRDLDEKRKSPFCGMCNRKRTKKVFPYYFFDFDVLKSRTLFVKPISASSSQKPKVKKPTVKKKVAQKRKRSLSKNANNIDPIALEKVREKNRQHRLEEEKKSKVKKTVQSKTDAQLIAEFLQNNEPSVKVSTEPQQDIYYGEVYISPQLEWA